MHQQQGRTLAALNHMQPYAGRVDESSGRRQARPHPPRRAGGEQRQPAADGGQDQASVTREVITAASALSGAR